MTKRITIALVLLLAAAALAQRGPGRGKGLEARPATILGQVLDRDLEVPVEYANVVLYRLRDSMQVAGTVTGESGGFELTVRPGRYYLEVSFIGYRPRTVGDIQIAPGASLDIGSLSLRQAIVAVEGAEAVADRPTLIYKIDKKTIEVSRMATTVSGTAVDVLENVPSVEVDIEGNVSLRGSENFTVLIDNRPTVLDATEALEQIPASTIENIEIITNPSAKYDPDGVSGIINIILRKKKLQGISGLFNLNLGTGERYGGDALLSARTGILNAFAGGNYNKRASSGSREIDRWTARTDSAGDTTYNHVASAGASSRDRTSYGVRAGVDLQFTRTDRTSLSGRWGGRSMLRGSDLDYFEWSVPDAETTAHISEDVSRHGGDYLSARLDHQHDFGAHGHQLLGSVSWSRREGDEESTTELFDTLLTQTSGQRSTEEGPRNRLTGKLDYTLPLRGEDKFEAGYQARIETSTDISKAYVWDSLTNSYVYQEPYSHTAEYARDIHSLYSLYGGTIGKFGFQAGMRGEYTDRVIEVSDSAFVIDRLDYFPTLHFSYSLPAEQQVMMSYTRRIHRSRGWQLEPFLSWQDAYNVRQGNPGLLPENIDSYELGYQLPWGRNRVSAEAYYRVTGNNVERVQRVAPDSIGENVILHSFANVGTDYSLGLEAMLNLTPVSWWTITAMGDVYDYRVEGELYGDTISRSSFNWGGRLNNDFKLPTGTRLQLNSRFRSPSVRAQGDRAAFFTINGAIKQEFLDRRLSLTLQVRDILGTGRHDFTSSGDDFYSHMMFDRESPVVSLSLSYNFNNFRQERRQRGDGEDFEDEGEYE